MTGKRTPFHTADTNIYLANNLGGFSVRHCPDADELAAMIVRAVNAHEGLVEALETLLVIRGSTGNPVSDFDRQAEAFQRDTGKMRPGKDVPAVAGDIAATLEEYAAWISSKIADAHAALALAGETP